MERIGVWLVALATAVLCLAACLAPAARANGGKTIADASGVDLDKANRGSLYNSNFLSGYSATFYALSFAEGDRITIKTKAADGVTPPCQILYMPGANDTNLDGATPILDPASTTRTASTDHQRWVATETGIYVLAMTNDDIFLSGPHECLDAPSESPFTFTVKISHGGGESTSEQSGGSGNGGGEVGSSGRTHVVKPGQSLWVIAQGLIARRASIAQIAFEVGRLWRLNAARIGTGDPDLIYAGQRLRLR